MLFINAWESDFYKEPVIAILSEFIHWLNEDKKEKDEGDKKELKSKILRVVGNIANQVLQHKTGVNFKEAISLCKDNSDQEKGENILKGLQQRTDAIAEMKQVISDYVQSKKLLIIVDELDRTRPDYAVRFLEDMKHFFDIENVIFIVAVNRKQMEATVKCLYGQSLDFDGYYRKFFKQEMDLPDPYEEAQRFIDDLIRKTKVQYNLQANDRKYRVKSSYFSCRMFNLTLREIESFIRIFEQILGSKTQQVEKWIYMDCYSFFICLFFKKKEIFNQILEGNFTVSKFVKFVKDNNFQLHLGSDEENDALLNGNNYLLGGVACSFMPDEEREIDIDLITRTFQTCNQSTVQDILSPLRGGFELAYGQPALDICKKIHQCKSIFQ